MSAELAHQKADKHLCVALRHKVRIRLHPSTALTKSDMEIQRYNRLKIVLAEKERTGTWLSEQMGHSISTVSRWMTNKVQPSVEQLYEIARHLDVDVKELLVSSK